MINWENLKRNSEGLIPAIIRDGVTGDVLMLAYMNKESYEISLEKKLTCFYSRSRKCLWLKGETSGNYQHIVAVTADCDMDTLLIDVIPDGPACHTGAKSCFFNNITGEERFTFDDLYELIKDRKANPKEGSYTTYLFDKGIDKMLKKVGEEATEVIIGTKNSREEEIYEIADLCYHVMVLMVESGITVDEIRKELASRHVVDKKIKQEKMQ
ncbi:MAG: bifunctional phosphoribosyl-AMP cyclohydrolase/phosphoribosyl-ATP diphosphatase HisIE [Eubacteriales bacterium]|nr:bifunctional phosphoribosyl-AMP cyclohydrolase/phosphoribosyl-ATP diphosphatase HisIE [Eubacteriales bacterium]